MFSLSDLCEEKVPRQILPQKYVPKTISLITIMMANFRRFKTLSRGVQKLKKKKAEKSQNTRCTRCTVRAVASSKLATFKCLHARA